MMTIMPEGEDLRKAVKWLSDEKGLHPEKKLSNLIQEACIKFDLSPLDAEFLSRAMRQQNNSLSA